MPMPCSICIHPEREAIDEMLRERQLTLQEIITWCHKNCPDHVPSGIKQLSKHRSYHISTADGTAMKLHEGQLVAPDNVPIERVSTIDALNAVITIGMRNALMDPEKVTMRDMLEAIRLLKGIGLASGEMDTFFKEWGRTIKRRGPRSKKIIDITPEEELRGWDDEMDA